MLDDSVIDQAADFIRSHLDEKISVDDIAAFTGYSKFYFSRAFKRRMGEGVHEFARRLRLEKCAFDLKTKNCTITEICSDAQILPANFTGDFKRQIGVPPHLFRKRIKSESMRHPFFHEDISGPLESFGECDSKITIETLPDFWAVYERHIGSYENLSADWAAFIKRCEPLWTADSLFIEMTFDDPSITRTDACMYDLCMTVSEESARTIANTKHIRGGTFAVYRHVGSTRAIYAAYQSVFTVWLARKRMALDTRRDSFDIYRKVDYERDRFEVDLCFAI